MALKTSVRWQHRKRSIEMVLRSSDPRNLIRTPSGETLTAADAVEELERDSPLGEEAMETFFS